MSKKPYESMERDELIEAAKSKKVSIPSDLIGFRAIFPDERGEKARERLVAALNKVDDNKRSDTSISINKFSLMTSIFAMLISAGALMIAILK